MTSVTHIHIEGSKGTLTMSYPPNSVRPGPQILNTSSTTKNFQSPEMASHVEEHQIWVQCESQGCLKWRLVPQVNNGGVRLCTEKSWFCSMNQDPAYSSCKVPQQRAPTVSLLKKHGLDFVFSQIPAGSLVSVKLRGWPWWPAIMSPDPCTGLHLIQDGDGDVDSYHVEFLGDPHSRCWAKAKCVCSYRSISIKVMRTLNVADRKSYDFAIQEVHHIRNMTCEERLLFCHFQPNDLLIKAQKLMREIEELIKQVNSDDCSSQKAHCKGQRWCQECSIEEDGDALIIEGFRFESAARREDLVQATYSRTDG